MKFELLSIKHIIIDPMIKGEVFEAVHGVRNWELEVFCLFKVCLRAKRFRLTFKGNECGPAIALSREEIRLKEIASVIHQNDFDFDQAIW